MATRESANLKLTLEDNEEFAGIEVTAGNFEKIDEAYGKLHEEAENASKKVTVSVIKNGVTVSASKSFDTLKAEFEKGNEILCELTVTGDEAASGGICTVCRKTDTALLFFTWIQSTLWLVKGAASGWEVTSFQPAESGHSHRNATQAAPGFLSAEDKTKLDGIASNANNYSLPTASSSTLGGIKVGENLSMAEDGTLSASGGIGRKGTGKNSEIFNSSYNTASGDDSHAEGGGTSASGMYSHAEGQGTRAQGIASHAAGIYTIANNFQTAVGKFNTENEGCPSWNSQAPEHSMFIVGNGYYNGATGTNVRSNAFRTDASGQSFGLKAFGASGADFAEYFEWLDGNPNSEDRRGKFVTLDGDKIKLANAGDFIVGVVSSMAAFLGNTSSEQWQGRYLQDVFGDWIQEEVEIPERTDEATGKVIPSHTAVQYALNPDYDPTQEYVSRQFRKEWSPIGMLGQVVVVDDGTCTVGGFCNAGVDGIGTAAENGYKVMKRIDNTHVKVLVK